jgi:hypothetical protein
MAIGDISGIPVRRRGCNRLRPATVLVLAQPLDASEELQHTGERDDRVASPPSRGTGEPARAVGEGEEEFHAVEPAWHDAPKP